MADLLFVSIKDIIVDSPNRGRKTFTKIAEMAESIKKYGLIQPLVVTPHGEGKYLLVAGERRYRGSVLAGVAKVPVVLRSDADYILAEIELEENVMRENLSFEEQGILFERIRELKRKEDPSAGIKEVAEMTNRSVGDVSEKISIARKFRERPELREACEGLPLKAAMKKIERIEEAERIDRLAASGQITLSTEIRHGSCVDLIKDLADESVSCILTDPPYGLEKLEVIRSRKGSMKFAGHQLMSDSHNQGLENVLELLSELAPDFARVLKPGGHWYIFAPFQYIGFFVQALEPHLEFIPPILIWDRGRPSVPAYGYNYMSTCEAIIYGCKPPRSIRLQNNTMNRIECPDVPRNLRFYPTEKPQPLLKQLIENSTITNDLILDPFAGSGSTLLAARSCARRAIGFEISQETYLRVQDRLRAKE